MSRILKGLLQVVVILGIGAFSIWATSLVTKDDSKEEIVKEIIKEVGIRRPICPDSSTYADELRKSGKYLILAQNLTSYGEKDLFKNLQVILVKRTGSGSEIACGYLAVNVSIGSGPINEWENLYIKPSEFGGHIVSAGAIVNQNDENATRMLFNLAKMEYREGRSQKEVLKADWAALFNVSDRVKFDIAVNSENPLAKINRLEIIYQCWNPETGQKTNDCQLIKVDSSN